MEGGETIDSVSTCAVTDMEGAGVCVASRCVSLDSHLEWLAIVGSTFDGDLQFLVRGNA